jgi:hypothetical protein
MDAGLAGVIAGGDMKIRAVFTPIFQCHEQPLFHALVRLSASSLQLFLFLRLQELHHLSERGMQYPGQPPEIFIPKTFQLPIAHYPLPRWLMERGLPQKFNQSFSADVKAGL